MGRYRPPATKSSVYITRQGYESLQGELKAIWKHRAEVTKALSAAAAEGDRSENAEYIYRKKELREIDARVRYLRKRLDGIVVVDRVPDDQSKVYFGAWVRLEDSSGEQFVYRIVGPDEFDTSPGYISMDSPMGKALLGKVLDDEFSITVETKDGTQTQSYIINEISYSSDKN